MHNWHIDCMAEYLMACYRRDIKRLIINIPPRSLKSVSTNVAFPAWAMGHDPTMKIMSASYSLDLSLKHSVDCRAVMQDDWYKTCFPNTMIAPDQNEKGKFMTTQRGERFATSVGATTTGAGGDILIIDDCHSADQAQSDTIRESQLEWFDRSFSTRLNDKARGVIIVIMQRLHHADLTGHLLKLGGWEHLCLPAIFDRQKTISIGNFHRKIKSGEILHSDRENKKLLEIMRTQMGEYAFAGQYLQIPTPEGGGIIKRAWFNLWPHEYQLPKFTYIIQSWDTAFTEKTSGDPSACVTFGVFFPEDADMEMVARMGGGYAVMVIDCFSEHLGFPDLREKMLEMRNYAYGAEEKRVDLILVEQKASGQSIIQELLNANLPVRASKPGRLDKVSRLHAISHLIENGLLYIPESNRRPGEPVSWAMDYINQLCTFPASEHDDYVDCTSQALKMLSDMDFMRADGYADDFEEDEDSGLPVTTKPNPYGH